MSQGCTVSVHVTQTWENNKCGNEKTEFMINRVSTSVYYYYYYYYYYLFHKMLGSSRVAAQLAASQEGLSSMSERVSECLHVIGF
jgi:hypothetical protein